MCAVACQDQCVFHNSVAMLIIYSALDFKALLGIYKAINTGAI